MANDIKVYSKIPEGLVDVNQVVKDYSVDSNLLTKHPLNVEVNGVKTEVPMYFAKEGFKGNVVSEKILEAMLHSQDLFNRGPYKNVMDMGCGAYTLTNALVQLVFPLLFDPNVTFSGVDPSEQNMIAAAYNIVEENLPASLYRGKGFEPVNDQNPAYDLIYCDVAGIPEKYAHNKRNPKRSLYTKDVLSGGDTGIEAILDVNQNVGNYLQNNGFYVFATSSMTPYWQAVKAAADDFDHVKRINGDAGQIIEVPLPTVKGMVENNDGKLPFGLYFLGDRRDSDAQPETRLVNIEQDLYNQGTFADKRVLRDGKPSYGWGLDIFAAYND